MATMLSVTIDDSGVQQGKTRKSERAFLQRMLLKIADDLASGRENSSTAPLDDNGHDVGSWTYTPIASA